MFFHEICSVQLAVLHDFLMVCSGGCVVSKRFAGKPVPFTPLAASETSRETTGIVLFPLGPFHNAPGNSSTIAGGSPFLPRESAFASRRGGVDQFDCELCVNAAIGVSRMKGSSADKV